MWRWGWGSSLGGSTSANFQYIIIGAKGGEGGEISGLMKIVDDSNYHDKTLDSMLTKMMSLSLPGNISVLLLVAPYLALW